MEITLRKGESVGNKIDKGIDRLLEARLAPKSRKIHKRTSSRVGERNLSLTLLVRNSLSKKSIAVFRPNSSFVRVALLTRV